MSNKVVIMAGGRGTRLRPFTYSLPKPLMPVGEKPIMEILIERIAAHGFKDFIVCTGYLEHLIRAYFGTGEKWGVEISYSHEPEPMGTAGALSLVRDKLKNDFVVVNGDTLTDLNWRGMMELHQDGIYSITMGATIRKIKIDLGVITEFDGHLSAWEEKPEKLYLVAMGAYIMNPLALRSLPDKARVDMPDLIRDVHSVAIYKHSGQWLDLGNPEDYAAACEGASLDA